MLGIRLTTAGRIRSSRGRNGSTSMTSLLDVMTRRPRPLTNLARGDRVVLFPSLGHLSRDGRHWIVHVHGDVSTAGKMTLGKRVLLRLLKRAMRASNEELAGNLFQQ